MKYVKCVDSVKQVLEFERKSNILNILTSKYNNRSSKTETFQEHLISMSMFQEPGLKNIKWDVHL